MAIPKFLEDVKIISKLGDFPRSDDNLSPEQFRAKFDEGAQLIKDFLNNDLIPNINAIVDVQALLNSVIDKTLTLQDKAAEAKAVGEALAKKLSLSGGTMTGPIDMGSHAIENIPYPTENAHPATKGYVDNHKVDRAHLADDALYSPLKNELSRDITVADIGCSIYAGNIGGTFTLTQANSSMIPVGGEIAIFRWDSPEILIAFSGDIHVGLSGNNGFVENCTLKIPDMFNMVAMKKIADVTSGDYWFITGNVEVV